jgi:hypothetical protein
MSGLLLSALLAQLRSLLSASLTPYGLQMVDKQTTRLPLKPSSL